MTMSIKNLEKFEELDHKTMESTHGARGLSSFRSQSLRADQAYSTKSGGTAGTRSICHVDGTDDGDSGTFGGFGSFSGFGMSFY